MSHKIVIPNVVIVFYNHYKCNYTQLKLCPQSQNFTYIFFNFKLTYSVPSVTPVSVSQENLLQSFSVI